MLDKAVQEAIRDKKWRSGYMTLQQKYSAMREEGRAEERQKIVLHRYQTNKI